MESISSSDYFEPLNNQNSQKKKMKNKKALNIADLNLNRPNRATSMRKSLMGKLWNEKDKKKQGILINQIAEFF